MLKVIGLYKYYKLDIKECILEIKLIILEKLTINENYFKGLVKVFKKEDINFKSE
jgi:hypothetical protein